MEDKSVKRQQNAQRVTALVMIAATALVMSLAHFGWSLAWLILYLPWAIACEHMAQKRGRSPAGGIVAGYYFGFFGVLYYLIAGDSTEVRVIKEEEARRKYHAKLKGDV